jgi:hypothetical protein
MRPEQIYKYRIDYEDRTGKLVRIWSPGKYARMQRLGEKIQAVTFKLRTQGCRPIAWEIWDTKASRCVESFVFPLDR